MGKKAFANFIGEYMTYGHLVMSNAEVYLLQTS
jgi:hypothetical protein